MIALLQRVSQASVSVEGNTIANIGRGLLVLLAVEPVDGQPEIQKLADKLFTIRVFADDSGKMNLDVAEAAGEVLLVPQFTLAADTSRGRRPGFSNAASPAHARNMFEAFCAYARCQHPAVKTGEFGADMQVALINDGPVTFLLQVPAR